MSLLSIQDLSLSIHGQSILDFVSMDIGPGEICGVIGESGSGKSLTALSVMQLLPEGATCSGSIAYQILKSYKLMNKHSAIYEGGLWAWCFKNP